MKYTVLLIIGILLFSGFVFGAYNYDCKESDHGKNYLVKGDCEDDDEHVWDYCDGYYWIIEYSCFSGCEMYPGQASFEVQGVDPNCVWGCVDGRCAHKGEILDSLGLTWVPGTCLDTDGGIDKFNEGICIDKDGNYYIERCNKGFVNEFHCNDQDNCVRAYGEDNTFCPGGVAGRPNQGGCREGACRPVDTTVSGCCLNPNTVACDRVEDISECCPSTNYPSGTDQYKGPTSLSDCKDNFFVKTESPTACSLLPSGKAGLCTLGCCCSANPDGTYSAETKPNVACEAWIPFESLVSYGGCTPDNCAGAVGGGITDSTSIGSSTTTVTQSSTTIVENSESTGIDSSSFLLIALLVLGAFIFWMVIKGGLII